MRDVLEYYSAVARAAVRPADPRRRRPRRHVPGAARRGRRDHAVELPHDDRVVGLRAGARGRQRGRAEARGVDPAHEPAARRARPRGGAARRAVPGRARQGLGRRRALRDERDRAQGRVHGLDRGRQAHHGGLRRPGEARDARARRQEREHRVRRRRPRAGRRHGAVRRVRERRPGLLRPQPHPRRAQRLRPLHGAPRAGGRRASRSAIRPTRPPRWARSSRASTSSACARSCPTTRMSRSAAPRPTGPGYWFAPTVLTPARDSRAAREEIFGPVVSVFPFDDEADAIRFANASEYGLSGSIWTRDLSRGIRVARAVESGNLSVNSHSSVRYATPFGGFKQSGLGRELGPDAPLAFTETKNVFLAVDPRRSSSAARIETRTLRQEHHDRPPPHRPHAAARRPRRRHHRRRVGHRARHGEAPRGRGREGRDRRPRRRARARPRPTLVDGLFVQVDVTDEAQVDHLFDAAADAYGSVDIAFNNAGHLAARRRLDRDDRAAGLAEGAGRQPEVGVPLLARGAAAHGRAGPRLDHQHRVVRGGAGLGDVADLVHGVEGRRARDEP